MAVVSQPSTIKFQRMSTQDIEEMSGWLVPRIQATFPRATPQMIRTFLIQADGARDHWLGRTPNAAALAYVQPGILGLPNLIKTVFAFSKTPEEDQEEIAELYWQITQWATRMEAGGVEMSAYTDDAGFSYVRSRVDKLYKRQILTWKPNFYERL